MAAIDRDFRVGCFALVFGLYICWTSFTMPSRGGLVESPGIFPGLMGILLVLFAVILMARSWKKGGRIHPTRIFGSALAILKSQVHRPVIVGIVLPGIYVFVGIPLIGFYLSSALFMTVMFYLFVKKWRKWFLFLPIALGITGILYLTFTRLFQLQIW
ncbi:MAG: tripartite tricarboxylate transporter TctB family protein [Syntrophales bacterium]|nr:tripartite tricarboxylate transporter TctB family protein [Syntrophales bacterium]